MPPSGKNKAPLQEVDGATETHNKRATRSATKGIAISSEDMAASSGAMGENGSDSSRVTRVKWKATDNKPKRPDTQPQKKKTAKRGTKKAVNGHGAAQQPDDVDEGGHNDPSPTHEEERAHENPPRRRRSYAPVTILENEDPESNYEDNHSESEDTGNGVLSNQNRKRKRPTHPDADIQPGIEADYMTVDEAPLPQIQSKINQPNRQTTPPTQSDLPGTSPHHSPPSPHTTLDAEDETAKYDEPKPKLTTKALRNARAEEPKFTNSGSDDEAPAGKRHKVAVGDGKKPPITKEDPVFDAVYKSATGELKRQICFVNPFPDSVKSDNLPRAVYNHGVHSVIKSGLYSHDDLRKLTTGYDGQWFSCLNHRISSLRAQLKKTTLRKVHDHFSKMSDETRNTLLTTNKYWYGISATGGADLGRPFLNEAIIDTLKEEYFDGRKSLYKLYPQEFKQSLATEDGGRGLEIPPRLVALVATFIYHALSAGDKSVQNWKYETFNQVYEGHLTELKKIEDDNPQCYHLILNLLFSKCIGDNGPKLAQLTMVSKNDYSGLNPANFST